MCDVITFRSCHLQKDIYENLCKELELESLLVWTKGRWDLRFEIDFGPWCCHLFRESSLAYIAADGLD